MYSSSVATGQKTENYVAKALVKNEKIMAKIFIKVKNITQKRLTPIAFDGKIVKLRIKD